MASYRHHQIHPVILCGGAGSRLWPLSRQSYPKQFTDLLGGLSLFQRTAERLTGEGFAPPWIVTGENFRFTVTDQLAQIGMHAKNILLEPEPKNTGPAICALALAIEEQHPGGLMLVSPSDHLIPDGERFRQAVLDSAEDAGSGRIVLFGIAPTRPETGYGWIQTKAPTDREETKLLPIARFVEKPDLATATALLQGEGNFWNAGIFLFRSDVIIAAFEEFFPDIVSNVRKSLADATSDLGFRRLGKAGWCDLQSISVDYAIMEKAQNLYLKPYHHAWSDLGDWSSIKAAGAADEHGNSVGENVTYVECKDTMLRSTSEAIEVVGVNLENILVIAMPDAVLVADSSKAQNVRIGVDLLTAKGASQAVQARRDFRPWGWFESIDKGPGYQAKRLVINPGGTLSLQSHRHRSEHWIVVRGVATVTLGETERSVQENESVFIPVGVRHRLANRTKEKLVIIEVQTGSYLGEDDITRYEDVYDRTG